MTKRKLKTQNKAHCHRKKKNLKKKKKRKKAYKLDVKLERFLRYLDIVRVSFSFIFYILISYLFVKWLIRRQLEPLYEVQNVLYSILLVFVVIYCVKLLSNLMHSKPFRWFDEIILFTMIIVEFIIVILNI